jgi:hypothetical protein
MPYAVFVVRFFFLTHSRQPGGGSNKLYTIYFFPRPPVARFASNSQVLRYKKRGGGAADKPLLAASKSSQVGSILYLIFAVLRLLRFTAGYEDVSSKIFYKN